MSVKIKQELTTKDKAKTNTYNNFTLVGILGKLIQSLKKKYQELQIIIKSKRKQKPRDHDR